MQGRHQDHDRDDKEDEHEQVRDLPARRDLTEHAPSVSEVQVGAATHGCCEPHSVKAL